MLPLMYNVCAHALVILSKRENLVGFDTAIESDSAALNGLVADMVYAVLHMHCLRDPPALVWPPPSMN